MRMLNLAAGVGKGRGFLSPFRDYRAPTSNIIFEWRKFSMIEAYGAQLPDALSHTGPLKTCHGGSSPHYKSSSLSTKGRSSAHWPTHVQFRGNGASGACRLRSSACVTWIKRDMDGLGARRRLNVRRDQKSKANRTFLGLLALKLLLKGWVLESCP